MIQAGKLRHKITIQENQYPVDDFGKALRDEYGATIDNWVDIWTGWASKEPLSGREYFAAQQIQAEQMTKFKIRYQRIQIHPGMRIKWNDPVLNIDHYFDIVSPINLNELNREVWIMTIEQVKKIPALTL